MCLFKIYRKYRSTPKQKTDDKCRGFPGRPLGGQAAMLAVVVTLLEAWRTAPHRFYKKTLSIERLGAHVLFKSY